MRTYSIWCVPAATAVHRPTPAVDRSERRAQNRAYYAGAYRYWLQHDAPSRWHPWRWIRASLLAVRGGLTLVSAREAPPARW